jgi:hypothetical protein
MEGGRAIHPLMRIHDSRYKYRTVVDVFHSGSKHRRNLVDFAQLSLSGSPTSGSSSSSSRLSHSAQLDNWREIAHRFDEASRRRHDYPKTYPQTLSPPIPVKIEIVDGIVGVVVDKADAYEHLGLAKEVSPVDSSSLHILKRSFVYCHFRTTGPLRTCPLSLIFSLIWKMSSTCLQT